MQVEKFSYDNQIVKQFMIAAVTFAIVGMLVGLIIAIQLYVPDLNLGIQYLTYGRIRPLHTNAVIFAFVGNIIFAGIYYSLQRVCKTRMWNDNLSQFHFWGWQLIILAAAISLPLGITTSKEQLRFFFGADNELHFRQSPQDKLDFILRLQESGKKVLMIGDGLNDAGALKQSDVGISISDNTNNF